jgi:hypothetical protein
VVRVCGGVCGGADGAGELEGGRGHWWRLAKREKKQWRGEKNAGVVEVVAVAVVVGFMLMMMEKE